MDDAALARFGRNLAQMVRIVEAELEDLSLTAYRILLLVAQGDERSSQIAGRLAVGRPTVSNAVESLVARNLLSRAEVQEDRRAIRLELTPAGREALKRTDRALSQRLKPIFEKIDDPGSVVEAMAAFQTASAATRAERRATRRRTRGT